MNNEEKDLINLLKGLDDDIIEEIAEEYPALDENAVNRILNKCNANIDGEAEDGTELTVTGTERYNRPTWQKYLYSGAAAVVAVVGITGVVLLHRNMGGNDFDLSNPPVIEDGFPDTADDYSDGSDENSLSGTVTTQTKLVGYIAGGFTTTSVTSVSETAETTSETTAKSTEASKTQPSAQTPSPTQPPEITPPDDSTPAVTESPEEPSAEPPTDEYDMNIDEPSTQNAEVSTEAYIENTVKNTSLVGVWFSETETGINVYEFYSDSTGLTYIDGSAEVMRFQYDITENNGIRLTFSDDGVTVKEGNIVTADGDSQITVNWNDSTTQIFYSESAWSAMVQ